MLERDIESWSKRKAKAAGYWVRKFKSPGNRSVPDDVFARRGRTFYVEFKATGETPTPLQADEHRQMREAGLTVYWTDCREGFAYIMERESSWLVPPAAFDPGVGVVQMRDGKLDIRAE